MKDLVFGNLFNSNLLFYSWNQLKSQEFLGCFIPANKFPPFSDDWFKKTSYMIRCGKFTYKPKTKLNYFKYKNRKNFLNVLNQFVIELSFINIMERINNNSLDFNLTKCLRYLKVNYFCYHYLNSLYRYKLKMLIFHNSLLC